jgi:hypothetical protein
MGYFERYNPVLTNEKMDKILDVACRGKVNLQDICQLSPAVLKIIKSVFKSSLVLKYFV